MSKPYSAARRSSGGHRTGAGESTPVVCARSQCTKRASCCASWASQVQLLLDAAHRRRQQRFSWRREPPSDRPCTRSGTLDPDITPACVGDGLRAATQTSSLQGRHGQQHLTVRRRGSPPWSSFAGCAVSTSVRQAHTRVGRKGHTHCRPRFRPSTRIGLRRASSHLNRCRFGVRLAKYQGSSGMEVERNKGKDQLLDLACRAQHAHIGTAVRNHRQVFQSG